MKKKFVVLLFSFFSIFNLGYSQDWMESMDIAKRLARTQDKLILMVWEEASYYPLSVLVRDKSGKEFFVADVFSNPELESILWEYFVLVKVNEVMHQDMYKDITGKRSKSYIAKFNDDSIKVMDANGNILATSGTYTELLDLSNFISRYAINTSFLRSELINYATNNNFYATYYLASKYIDFSISFPKKVRYQLLDLSEIYFGEATALLENNQQLKEKEQLLQRVKLTSLKKELIKGNPRRVLRQLKKMNAKAIDNNNKPLVVFLYYTAYRLLNNKEEFSKLESDISLVNLKQVQAIVNINR